MSAEQSHGFDIQDDVRFYWGSRTSQHNKHDRFDIPQEIVANWNLFPFAPCGFHVKAVKASSKKQPFKYPQGNVSLSDAQAFISQTDPYGLVMAVHIPWGGNDAVRNTHVNVVQIVIMHVSMDKHKELLGKLTLEHAVEFNKYIHSLNGHKDDMRDAAQEWKKKNLPSSQDTSITLSPKIDEHQCRIQAGTTIRKLSKVIEPHNTFRAVNPDFDPDQSKTAPIFLRQLLPMFRNYSHKERNL